LRKTPLGFAASGYTNSETAVAKLEDPARLPTPLAQPTPPTPVAPLTPLSPLNWPAPAGSSPNRGCRHLTREPVSRILFRTSSPAAVIPLGEALPLALSSDLPGGFAIAWSSLLSELPAKSRLNASGRCVAPPGSRRTLPSLFGLAPCGVYPAAVITAGAVRSYRTFSPLPGDSPSRLSPFGPEIRTQPQTLGAPSKTRIVRFGWKALNPNRPQIQYESGWESTNPNRVRLSTNLGAPGPDSGTWES
jgi:hypothetical protein